MDGARREDRIVHELAWGGGAAGREGYERGRSGDCLQSVQLFWLTLFGVYRPLH